MNLSERCKWARKKANKNQSEMAKMIGISRAGYAQWESGATKTINSERLHAAAKALNVNPEWLATGKNPLPAGTSLENIEKQDNTKSMVPVISWVQAGNWCEAQDEFHPGSADDYLPCPSSHSNHSYALRVRGDSMTSSFGRSYPEGAIIFVDPEQSASNGDRVIAKINGENSVTFKCFIDDGGQKFLKPLNQQHPIITDEFKIIGKVIGMYIPE